MRACKANKMKCCLQSKQSANHISNHSKQLRFAFELLPRRRESKSLQPESSGISSYACVELEINYVSGLKSCTRWANHNLQCGPAIWQAPTGHRYPLQEDHGSCCLSCCCRCSCCCCSGHTCCGCCSCLKQASCVSCQWTCTLLIDLYCVVGVEHMHMCVSHPLATLLAPCGK